LRTNRNKRTVGSLHFNNLAELIVFVASSSSLLRGFLKNIGIRAASVSRIRAAATTGRMMVRADSGVASILIPKTVQNGIRGCFISHPQKNSSKQFIQNGIRGCFISHPQKFSYIRCYNISFHKCPPTF
jgi:hypothetical protein